MTTALTTPPVVPVDPALAPIPVADPPAAAKPVASDPKVAPVETKPADVKPVESAPIELKFPEGFRPDEKLLEVVKPLFKELGLDSPKAQKLADAFAKHQLELEKSNEATAEQTFKDMRAGYVKDTRADKEIGGSKYDATVAAVGRAYSKFGNPELTKLLEATGMGDHPEMVRAFAKIGHAMAEDTVGGKKEGNGAGTLSDREKLLEMYPSMRPGAVQPGPKQ